MKEFVIKDTPGFQLKIKKWECLSPKGLYTVHFIQSTKDKDGNIDNVSTYEFFLNHEDLTQLAGALTE